MPRSRWQMRHPAGISRLREITTGQKGVLPRRQDAIASTFIRHALERGRGWCAAATLTASLTTSAKAKFL